MQPFDCIVPGHPGGQEADQEIVVIFQEAGLVTPDDGCVCADYLGVPTYLAYLWPTYPTTYRPTYRLGLRTLRRTLWRTSGSS